MKKITVGNKAYETTYITDKGLVIGEVLPSGTEIKITLKAWESKDGKVQRYYVNRAGKSIGWISQDLTDCKGNTTTENSWCRGIMEAMQAITE